MATKKDIKVPPPTRKELRDASGELKKGHSSGGRVLNEQKKVLKTPPKTK